MIKTHRGLQLPIKGAPQQVIEAARPARTVALVGEDYIGMRPTMEVGEGDRVRTGELLFTDKKTPGVRYTAPAPGTVSAINRGAKRALVSIVIDVDTDSDDPGVSFDVPAVDAIGDVPRELITEPLIASGLWTALRTRPFARVPAIDAVPHSLFVTAMDTNPLAADPKLIIDEHREDFARGQDVLARLTDGPVFVCTAPGAGLPIGRNARIRTEEFDGPHPAGLAGTHIHMLDPVGPRKSVWYIGYQDVIAIGKLFATGYLWNERVVALGGPPVSRPRLLRTRLGANIDELCAGELDGEDNRLISGSVLAGRRAVGARAYVGRYHAQISVLPEDRRRHFLGYLWPGKKRHSVFPVYTSALDPSEVEFTTTTHGSARAMVPIGTYEAVLPHDVLATQLLRALLVGDVDTAIALGCLEFDEEDIALCTYACPGKYEYGPVLRNNLTLIEKEG